MKAIKTLLAHQQPVKWLFYGDSITHGAKHTWGARDYVELFDERVRFELDRYTDVIINTAISGDTAAGLIEGFDWRVAQFRPHVAFVMIGMNDCSQNDEKTFEENLLKLADRFATIDCHLIMQTTCTIQPDTTLDKESHINTYMDKIRHVAHTRNLPLIDHTLYWQQHADSTGYWLDDPFHPNVHGHRTFAHLIFQELGIFDNDSPTCRLLVP